jgi:hypothetical protein
MNKSIIIKIGGKILENRENIESTLSQFKSLVQEDVLQKVIIIPGGGSLADFIRSIDDKLNIGDELAHWMAIYAMDRNGIELCKNFSELNCINNYKELQAFLINDTGKSISVFLPYDYLVQEDQLPHNWKVTSDSISLHLANNLELRECYLIKNVEGIIVNINGQEKVIKEMTTGDYIKFKNNKMIEIKTKELKKSQPVDSYLLSLIEKTKIPCIILNGMPSKSRIIEYFKDKKIKNRIYTKIY